MVIEMEQQLLEQQKVLEAQFPSLTKRGPYILDLDFIPA